MNQGVSLKINYFWGIYLVIRIFYILFNVYIFSNLTSVGDSIRYLSSDLFFPTIDTFTHSTHFMDFIGGIVSTLTGKHIILSNLLFMLLSFFSIRWVIEKYNIRDSINNYLLLILLSLPHFCIWTSTCSKETFGLLFSCLLGGVFIDYMRNDFRIKWYLFIGLYFCILIKPIYTPFVIQSLVMLFVVQKMKKASAILFLTLIIATNIYMFITYSDFVELFFNTVHRAFEYDSAFSNSTRNIHEFTNSTHFYSKSYWGIPLAFFGPSIQQMMNSFLHLLAGLESSILILILFGIGHKTILDLIFRLQLNLRYVPIFILFAGILFMHYPFGIYNPGSAIRYRTNFIFLFILIIIEINKQYKLSVLRRAKNMTSKQRLRNT